MRRRAIAAVAAMILAVTGGALMLTYVATADQRAVADLEPVQVLVLTEGVTMGTPSESLDGLVSETFVPGTAVAPDALKTLEDVRGLVTTTDLVPGEQLVAARFVEPDTAEKPDSIVEVPAGFHEISIQLEPQRVIGGHLTAGDTVGVFASFTDTEQVSYTNLVLHKVLVTKVDGGVVSAPAPAANSDAEPAADGDEEPAEPTPAGQVTVTLALRAPDSEKLVWTMEFGTVWLSKEPLDAPVDGTRIVTGGNIYQ